jgi:hypothetical protein
MKKIILTLILSTISILTCHAQLTHTSEFVKIILPNSVYQLSKQQLDEMPRFKLSSKSNVSYAPPYAYKLGDIFIGLSNASKAEVNNNLPKQKMYRDEGYNFLRTHGNNTYQSVIKNVGKNKVLLLSYSFDNVGHYRFYCQNEAKTITQSGYIDYPIADAAKAEALLNDILNSIQFTK